MKDSFASRATLKVGSRSYRIVRLKALETGGARLDRLPFALRILLENLLRREDGSTVTAEDVQALLRWDPKAEPDREIAFMPARVLLQDFTGVPAIVDLAAMRDAIRSLGGDPKRINPLQPVELVIDHSVQVDAWGGADAFRVNAEREFERNHERYAFLRWGQAAFRNFKVVPPDTGIVHQVNLEYLARVVMTAEEAGDPPWAWPDTLVGTDSHTTMVNGLGVLGWGVGGIEAQAAMLGQPISMLIPQVVGFRLKGRLREGATATDLVLRVTEMLRKKGVVGMLVEFFGEGLTGLTLADRATIANMAPEYGATCGIFPVDDATLEYLRFTGRSPEQVELVEAYMREQGLFRGPATPEAEYTDTLELDLSTVESALAGPRRPQDLVPLSQVKKSFLEALPGMKEPGGAIGNGDGDVPVTLGGRQVSLRDGSVVIAAITSCTNTSNPSVLVAAGLLARKAVERGLLSRPWVKTSLAPGSMVVTEYLRKAGLTPYLDQLGFSLVGFGCTTCIGNSGPLPPAVSRAISEGKLVAVSVLSGNRNFEGRIHAEVRANYLASPPLVVAYALAGRIDLDPLTEPLGIGREGQPVFLKELWPTQREIEEVIRKSLRPEMFRESYRDLYAGDERWRGLKVPTGDTYAWDEHSTYVKHPPFFEDLKPEPGPVVDITGARALAVFGDSITTDHISPAGEIDPESPAGRYLQGLGVTPRDFNSYGARRGNYEVMMRGTFANVRIRNRLVPGVEGGVTVHLPDGERMSIFDAAVRYLWERVPLIVIAGKEYGSGSSRDWAAKGPRLLGVRAVIAQSFERIHRSNLVGMGIVPLQFTGGDSAERLKLTGREVFSVIGLSAALDPGLPGKGQVEVRTLGADGVETCFRALVRIETPQEAQYYRHGGILAYVLRQLAAPVSRR